MIFEIKAVQDNWIKKQYEKAMKELDAFFGLNWKRNRPEIHLVQDRKTIKTIWGEDSGDWIVGWVSGTSAIYILDRKNYEKESSHKYSDKEYSRLIKHELAHCFFNVFSKGHQKPKWLWEGVAMYVSKENDKRMKKKPEKFNDFLDYYISRPNKDVYKEAGFVVQFLTERFGKSKLLSMIKSLNEVKSERGFKRLFKQIYGFPLNYNEINKRYGK